MKTYKNNYSNNSMSLDRQRHVNIVVSMKPGRLRTYEKILLMINGWRDGRNGFPKLIAKDHWDSPIMAREIAAYEEFCARAWGGQQKAMQPLFEDAMFLLTDTKLLEKKVVEIDELIKKMNSEEVKVYRYSDDDTRAERKLRMKQEREKEAHIEDWKIHKRKLEDKIAEEKVKFLHIKNTIMESDHVVRMICEKAWEHTKMRILTYWRAALSTARGAEWMPPTPLLEMEKSAETTYISGHNDIYRNG